MMKLCVDWSTKIIGYVAIQRTTTISWKRWDSFPFLARFIDDNRSSLLVNSQYRKQSIIFSWIHVSNLHSPSLARLWDYIRQLFHHCLFKWQFHFHHKPYFQLINCKFTTANIDECISTTNTHFFLFYQVTWSCHHLFWSTVHRVKKTNKSVIIYFISLFSFLSIIEQWALVIPFIQRDQTL